MIVLTLLLLLLFVSACSVQQAEPMTPTPQMLLQCTDEPDRGCVRLRFTSPPDLASLDEALDVTRDEVAVPVSLEVVADEPRDVKIFGFDQGLGDVYQTTISVEVRWQAGSADGEPSDERVRSKTLSVWLASGNSARMTGLEVIEGADGPFLVLRCDDRHDTDTCTPEAEDLAAVLRLDPPVSVEVVPDPEGLILYGDFPPGVLRVSIEPGTTTQTGATFIEQGPLSVTVPTRRPRVELVSKGRFLQPDALDRLFVRHHGVPAIELEVRHVPRRNLPVWLYGYRSSSSDVVLAETLTVEPTEHTSLLGLELADRLPDLDGGILEIRVSAPQEEGKKSWEWRPSDVSKVVLTDLQLVVKRERPAEGEEHFRVWGMDAAGGPPVSGLEVAVIRESGTPIGTCRTRGVDGCRIRIPADRIDQAPPFAVVARRGDEVTLVEVGTLELAHPAEAGRQGYGTAETLRAATWLDRGIYRPGDTVHLAAVLRDGTNLAPPDGLPVTLDVVDARGNPAQSVPTSTNPAGLLTVDVPLSDSAATGRWTATLRHGDDQDLATVRFRVGEIAPERLEVTLTPENPVQVAADQAVFDLEARWLFDAPVAEGTADVSCTVRATRPTRKGQSHLTFGIEEGGDYREIPAQLVRLDAQGRARVHCPLSDVGPLDRTVRVVAEVAVHEGAGGRVTRAHAVTVVEPSPFAIGVRVTGDGLGAGQPVEVEGWILDTEGSPVSTDDVTVSLQRRVRVDGRAHVRVETTHHVDARDGFFSLELRPQLDSLYEVVVSYGEATTIADLDGRGSSGPSRPGHLVVSAPRSADPGDEVEVEVRVAEPGWLLTSAETDRVLDSHWQRVVPGTAKWSFLADTSSPNLYVSALLVRDPKRGTGTSPGRSHGEALVRLRPVAHQGALALELPAEVLPEQSLDIGLDLDLGEGPAWVTVAAVDEGLLSLTNHPSPDPLAALFQPRRPGVETSETVGWTVAIPSADFGAPGGGMGGRRRLQAIQPVALWSGPVAVGADGRAQVSLAVPDTAGALRVMAVGVSASKIATGSRRVRVRTPLLVQATTPRVLVEGDTVRIPVEVHNLTGAPTRVALEAWLEPVEGASGALPAEILRRDASPVRLEPGDRHVFRVGLAATGRTGGVRLAIRAQGSVHGTTRRFALPLRPAFERQRETQLVPLHQGQARLDDLLAGWVEADARIELTDAPFADVLERRDQLLGYPHGCAEQTSSRLRALMALEPLQLLTDLEMESRVQHGIQRLQSMQRGGGFAYWPGSDWVRPWPSLVAIHTLLDAREAGWSVASGTIERALDYAAGLDDHPDATIRAYAHLIRARGGRGDAAAAETLAESGEITKLAKVLARAAVALERGVRPGDELVGADLVGELGKGGTAFYGTGTRDQAMAFVVLRRAFGERLALEPLREAALRSLREARYPSTQTLAWCLEAAVEGLSDSEEDSVGALRRGGEVVDARHDGTWHLTSLHPGDRLHVESDPSRPLWASVTLSGERIGARESHDGGIRVTREVRTLDGEPAVLDDVRVGDALMVLVNLESTGTVPDVALVDRIPAGWELENVAQEPTALPSWLDEKTELWRTDHVDRRDDRVAAFGTLHSGIQTLAYTVRVVSPGTFTHPAAVAASMYKGEIRGWSQTGQITTRERSR